MDKLDKLKVKKFRILNDSELKETVGASGNGCSVGEYEYNGCSTGSCWGSYGYYDLNGAYMIGWGSMSCHYGANGCGC